MDWIVNIWNWLMASLPHFSHGEDYTGNLPGMSVLSLLVGLGCALVLMWLMAMMNRFRNGKWNVPGKLLTSVFCVTWLLGFIVYDIGTYTGCPKALVWNAPMAMIHAFEMFILESDAAALHPEFHNNFYFMSAFSMVHFLAAAVSLIFVVKHFGFNIVAGFKMFFEAYFKRSRKDTYVFWEMNEPTYLLAKNIEQYYEKNHPGEKRAYRIIIVRTGSDRDRTSARNGIDRLFNFLSLKNRDLERLQELRCLTANTFTDLSKLKMNTAADGRGVNVLKRQLNLRQLTRILLHKTSGTIHMFFMGEDASANIQSVSNLKKDK